MNKKSLGFYLSIVSAIIMIAGIIIYTQVMITSPYAYVFLVLSLLTSCGAVVMSSKLDNAAVVNLFAVCAAVFTIFALAFATTSMVYPIGYVISGLYQFSSIQTFIIFAIVVGVGWLFNLISGFAGIVKKA